MNSSAPAALRPGSNTSGSRPQRGEPPARRLGWIARQKHPARGVSLQHVVEIAPVRVVRLGFPGTNRRSRATARSAARGTRSPSRLRQSPGHVPSRRAARGARPARGAHRRAMPGAPRSPPLRTGIVRSARERSRRLASARSADPARPPRGAAPRRRDSRSDRANAARLTPRDAGDRRACRTASRAEARRDRSRPRHPRRARDRSFGARAEAHRSGGSPALEGVASTTRTPPRPRTRPGRRAEPTAPDEQWARRTQRLRFRRIRGWKARRPASPQPGDRGEDEPEPPLPAGSERRRVHVRVSSPRCANVRKTRAYRPRCSRVAPFRENPDAKAPRADWSCCP